MSAGKDQGKAQGGILSPKRASGMVEGVDFREDFPSGTVWELVLWGVTSS